MKFLFFIFFMYIIIKLFYNNNNLNYKTFYSLDELKQYLEI